MKQDFFKDTIKEQFQLEGNQMYQTNAELITDGLNNHSDDIVPINIGDLEKGKFYFMFCDLAGKSSRMEKFNPVFVIDWADKNDTRMLYAVSINFIPVSIRTVFFNSLCNFNLPALEKNLKKKTEDQYKFENIDFANIYKLLYAIGFEWSIREFDFKLINKVFAISTNILPKFITMSTARLTGVDDLKLIEIWQKKIKEQEQRHNRLIKEILGDYKTMEKEIKTAYTSLDTKNDNLQKSLQLIQKIF